MATKARKRKSKLTAAQVKRKYGVKSGIEGYIKEQLNELGVNYKYEERKIPWVEPIHNRNYTPDFFIYDKNWDLQFIVESKGRFLTPDRHKHEWVKEQYPDMDLRFVFTNSEGKDTGYKTTKAHWCKKRDFMYASKLIPLEWLEGLYDK